MSTTADTTATDVDDATTTEVADTAASGGPTAPEPRRIALRLSTLLTGLAVLALLIATIVFAALYFGARHDISDRDARTADDRHAEQIAGDYALGASTIDFHDTKAWFGQLKSNTTPQLAAKFDATSPQLDQILLPLQWTSKATPISSVVTSEANGIYKVNTFLNVTSTSAQTPDGTTTTVTYSLTVDSNNGWKITDVGGLDGALPGK